MLNSRRGLLVVFALLIVAAGVFAIWPNLDLAVSQFFYRGNGVFVGRGGIGPAARDFFQITPLVVLAAFVILYICRFLGLAVPYAPSRGGLVFLVATIVIGPLLTVNLGLKDHAHRPRPTQTQDFNGPYEFRPWYRFDGGCAKNCSFVSGEASQAFWMVAPASLAPPPLRPLAIGAALVFGAAASLLRVAAGGHYLSDGVFAALLTILIVQIARWLILGADAEDV